MTGLNFRWDQVKPPEEISPWAVPQQSRRVVPYLVDSWNHPESEAERLTELEGFLRGDFHLAREVKIAHNSYNGRIDLLAIPKLLELAETFLAFEVKGSGFDLERALKQSADYVGGRCRGSQISACFIYPTTGLGRDDERRGRGEFQEGMFNLIGQWRVGRGFVDQKVLILALGTEVIWDSRRGWHDVRAGRMLHGKRLVCGSRREVKANGSWRRF
jgi:hypothetical protein